MSEFKVGDLVVMIDTKIHNSIQKVTEQDIGGYYMKYWRHATPEEIKAGRRL